MDFQRALAASMVTAAAEVAVVGPAGLDIFMFLVCAQDQTLGICIW